MIAKLSGLVAALAVAGSFVVAGASAAMQNINCTGRHPRRRAK
jgi:hypothetical protein